MLDNTITQTPSFLTPQQLREALDKWCEEQPGVVRFLSDHPYLSDGYQAFHDAPDMTPTDLPKQWWYITESDAFESSEPGLIPEFASHHTFLALTALAIEHSYRPWLQLAATLPYAGAKAAQMALAAMGEPKQLSDVLERVQQDLDGRVEIVEEVK